MLAFLDSSDSRERRVLTAASANATKPVSLVRPDPLDAMASPA